MYRHTFHIIIRNILFVTLYSHFDVDCDILTAFSCPSLAEVVNWQQQQNCSKSKQYVKVLEIVMGADCLK